MRELKATQHPEALKWDMHHAMMGVLLFALAIAAPAEERVEIFFSGVKVGQQIYDWNVDDSGNGSFQSSTQFKIADTAIDSKLTGKVVKHVVSEFKLEETAGIQAGFISWSNGKADIEANGKKVVSGQAVPWDGKGFYSANHPLLSHFVRRAILEAGTKSPVDVFIPNSLRKFPAALSKNTFTTRSGVSVQEYSATVAGVEIKLLYSGSGKPVGMDIPSQMFRSVAAGSEDVFHDPLNDFPELSQPIHKTWKVHEKLLMSTRDGMVLAADVAVPEPLGRYPVVLLRTPYGRKGIFSAMMWLVQRGYVVVSQDVRGRGDSTGRWDPFNFEVYDGKDTLDWVVKQPWCDGNIGMIGASYGGLVQWAAAVNHHPALKCIIPQVSPPEPVRNIPWDHGCFFLAANIWWARLVAEKNSDMAAGFGTIANATSFNSLPISKVDDKMTGKNIAFYDNWLQRPTMDKWPGAFSLKQVSDVRIPVFHISGIWDGDGIGTKLHWEALRKTSTPQWLVFGPWAHAFNSSSKYGDMDYGPNAILALEPMYLRFYDTYLKGKSVNIAGEPRVRMFVTGANTWIKTADWPPPFSVRKSLFLSGGSAAGPRSKGVLSVDNSKTKVDRITYDPRRIKFMKEKIDVGGGSTSTKLESIKGDQLYYRSEAYGKKTVICGPIDVSLWVSSSARDASFHVAVVDEHPNGEKQLLGILGSRRMTWTESGFIKIKPHQIVPIEIRPWEFAHEFKPGHRLGILISNDAFPNYARVPGTGEPDITAKRLVSARNAIHCGKATPSRVTYSTFEL